MLCVRFSKRVIAVLGGLITGVAMVLTSFPLSLPYIYITYGVMAGTVNTTTVHTVNNTTTTTATTTTRLI